MALSLKLIAQAQVKVLTPLWPYRTSVTAGLASLSTWKLTHIQYLLAETHHSFQPSKEIVLTWPTLKQVVLIKSGKLMLKSESWKDAARTSVLRKESQDDSEIIWWSTKPRRCIHSLRTFRSNRIWTGYWANSRHLWILWLWFLWPCLVLAWKAPFHLEAEQATSQMGRSCS